MLTRGSDGYNSSINVTPLVDVVLVLLIIFMVIIPLTVRGYDVDIPGGPATAPPAEPVAQVVLEVDPRGCPVLEPPGDTGLPQGCSVLVNHERVPVTRLARRIGEIFADRQGPDRVLFLAADERLNYEGVMRIVDAARSSTDDLRIGFVTLTRPAGDAGRASPAAVEAAPPG